MRCIKLEGPERTLFITQSWVPAARELPWGDAACDAIVAIVDPALLTDEISQELPARIVTLPTEWVEVMGVGSEHLHDLVDQAAVTSGRQMRIGDGDPMTAWHNRLSDVNSMVEYMQLGGLGACANKLVVVIGADKAVEDLATRLRRMLG